MHLVRDRLGIKPLYWSARDGRLLFGSELRALMAHPDFQAEIDREAASAFLRYSYVPTPATIFRGVHKLPPGSILTVKAGEEPRLTPYWRLSEVIAQAPRLSLTADEAAAGLDDLLREAVRGRMIADVPIGAFLSGGVDSSLIVAQMQACTNRPVRSFTIGFREKAYDESGYAREVAQRLGTEHTEVTLGADDALALIGDIADWFDEPFADSSQLPTYLVSRMTRQHVTVALSGDGGDELFGGYPKYDTLEATWRRVGRLPRGLRALAGRGLGRIPEKLLTATARLALDPGRGERIGEKTRRFAAAMQSTTGDEAAAAINAVGAHGRELVLGATGALQSGAHAGTCGRPARSRLPHAGRGHGQLPARRHPHQGRPLRHGGVAGDARAAASTTASSNSSGRCRRRCGADASRRRCSNRCCSAICPWRWSTGPSAAFRCRSGNGWPDLCAAGRKSCWRRTSLPPKACSMRARCRRCGGGIWTGASRTPPRFGIS